jgi:hypothetical protein
MKKYRFLFKCVALLALTSTSSWVSADENQTCHTLYKKAVLNLDFNPTQIFIGKVDGKDALFVPSFYNTEKGRGSNSRRVNYLDRDKVGIVRDILTTYKDFDFKKDLEVISDLNLGRSSVNPGKIIWPNGGAVAPSGVFPFQAVVVPQGFHPARVPGRLTAINLDDPNKTEYVIHQSTQRRGPSTGPNDPSNKPRFYHEIKFFDMDDDGDVDIVTNRSGARVGGGPPRPPYGELLWFENPGGKIDPTVPWKETIIWGGTPGKNNNGPDTHLDMGDLDGDGYPEIIATNFFVGKSIEVFGAPKGGTWADVDWTAGKYPQYAVISNDQGSPMDVEIGDLNNDGEPDILASNHQPDQCHRESKTSVPGRVYGLEIPKDGNIYQPWISHVLKDNIRAQPSLLPFRYPGRLAPGPAHQFNLIRKDKGKVKPYILVGGDEAAKAWVLRPKKLDDVNNWEYNSDVIFDINDYYGENTSQTLLDDPFGISISTVGSPTLGYTSDGPSGRAEIYLPVFEAREIHVLSYQPGEGRELVECSRDQYYSCPEKPKKVTGGSGKQNR